MDFDLTEDQQLFRDTARRFLENTCPVSKVRELSGDTAGFERTWWRQAAQLGWLSLMVDEAAGGAGLGAEGPLYLAIVAEEMGRLVSPGPVVASSIVAAAISRAGTAEQRSMFLPRLVSGEALGAWCLAETAGSWDSAAVAVTAERTASGYRLNGIKTPVEAAAEADLLLVTARCKGDLAQFLVPAQTPGVAIERLEGLDLVRRFARVAFEAADMPCSALLGNASGSAGDIEHQLQLALALQCAESCGAADRVFEFTLEWMFDRFSFGRPLASYQALKHRFADMRTWLEASHAITSAAVRAVGQEEGDAARLTRVAKAYVGDRAPEIIQDCVQMHGGIGVTWDHDIHLYLRRVATNRPVLGSPAEILDRIANLLPLERKAAA